MGHYLFSFSGRINRAKMWAILLVALAFEFILVTLFGVIVGMDQLAAMANEKLTPAAFLASPQVHTFFLVCGVLYLVMLYVGAAIAVKRLHDRNKSAWWLLVFYGLPLVLSIPGILNTLDILQHMKAIEAGQPMPQPPLAIIGNGISSIISLWAFVELFILRGTTGDNRFGPDPLAPRP
ncbi:MAG: DUF805 domain-containing protein [Alphaproteobacteria bacterium]|nr:DUF805 domain-containing protein [Alphaproteobacteria bacterium]MBV9542132.1 DUF805 domain-containing protein [Alphaproteobacteria bacterium]MBV9904586.1 DUF805 domain-containing protein [Alphaproteobacteria bacterium]